MGARVSAIIPTYNYARFLARAVESVLSQTWPDVECIVVDDGSTDDTREVLARYGDRVRVLHQENRGLSAARNAGIAAARGDYLALLDADDYWRPEKLARQLALLEATPTLGAAGCWVQLVDADGAPMGQELFQPVTPEADLAAQLRAVALRRLWVGGSGSGAVLRREVLAAVGPFDDSLRAAEDWDMWMRVASRYPICNVPEVLVCICRHGTSSFRNAEKMELNQLKVFEAAVARWPDVLDERTRRRVRALILADAGDEYAGLDQHRMALRRYAAALVQWPAPARRWYLTARMALKQVGI